MLVKYSFRAHQISPLAAKKEKKKDTSSQSPEIDSLTFRSQQSIRKLVPGKSRLYNQ